MGKVYQIKNSNLILKDVDTKEGIVSGYFSAFGNKDSDGDILMPGAFARSINNNGPKSQSPRIKHLLNHNPSQPLGVLMELKEDEFGLAYTSRIGTHTLGQDFVKMAESGLITEHSIGFQVLKWEKDEAQQATKFTEVKLWEGSSLTAWGANELTPLTSVKGTVDAEQLEQKIAAIEKFCKHTDASDETIQALLIQIKQMQQMLIDATTPPAVEAQDSDIKKQAALEQQFITTILKHF
ncbi:COG3740 Phage head maturation protease [uncultured Caudovirales phage]|uniref:COG3740 Phage head maturation protease n=1 Tax=uncultured Caudovirales phage TaxID=2100421 RepID=A0A6J5M1L0_9CAUD|nr:COG3740 Phage head maturation protease [uncultured Caudovirales phage]